MVSGVMPPSSQILGQSATVEAREAEGGVQVPCGPTPISLFLTITSFSIFFLPWKSHNLFNFSPLFCAQFFSTLTNANTHGIIFAE